MKLFGIKLREDKLFLESTLIFDAASTLSKKIKNPEKKLEMIRFCVCGMVATNNPMIGEDRGMKVVVKDYVIPLTHDKLHYMESMSSVNKQRKCLQVSWVLHYIERSQYLVGQWKKAEQTLREGLKRMDEVLRENKIKYLIYGLLLNNLGFVCHNTSRTRKQLRFTNKRSMLSKLQLTVMVRRGRNKTLKWVKVIWGEFSRKLSDLWRNTTWDADALLFEVAAIDSFLKSPLLTL